MRARAALRQITPPIVASALRRHRTASDWEYVGDAWADDDGPGWDSQGVVDAYRRKLPSFRRAIAAPAPIGVATEALLDVAPSVYDQNLALQFAYGIARASAGRDAVAILDWGGGFGFMSFVARELYPELTFDYHVKDVASVVRAARDVVPEVTFWDDDTCLGHEFDLVLASSSLQYARDWPELVRQFGRAGRYVALNRLPITSGDRSFVVRQRAYDTTYDGWVISRAGLLSTASRVGLELVREFVEGWSVAIEAAPSGNEHRAFLFAALGRPGQRHQKPAVV